MRSIAHISDLHFGRHDPAAEAGLLADLAAAPPDLVAVSGDLTQRARRSEFAAARAFLARLPAPFIAVPGNHDVPLYNLARRALQPLKRFHRYVSDAPQPFFGDAELAVLGINTARAMALDNGRISLRQMGSIRDAFGGTPDGIFRILVTHHPLMPPPHAPARSIVGRAMHALEAIAASGIQLILTGHYHQAFTGYVASHHLTAKRSILVSQAGTAISTRLREEANSYNFIRIDESEVACELRVWTGARFVPMRTQVYARRDGQDWAMRQ